MKSLLPILSRLTPLSSVEMEHAIELLMNESAVTEAQIGAFLMASAVRLPTGGELAGAARAMRQHMIGIDRSLLPRAELLDTCGTGGSGHAKINISTAAALVCAAAGQPVAKHGNRSASGRSGSADVLEALGVRIDLSTQQVAQLLSQTNFGFLFAPQHHPATKRVGAIRRQLGIRTIFNFLGPLTNPFGAERQLVGVSEPRMVAVMAEALADLGTKHSIVVCAKNGLDEVSLMTDSVAFQALDGVITEVRLSPELLGLERRSAPPPPAENPEQSAAQVLAVLRGEQTEHRDWVLANSGVALYASGRAASAKDGVQQAIDILDSGRAFATFEAVRELSNSLPQT